ncbi:unnamed protein product [Schistosoma curassoni]|uniref:Uncharacterized protein n=1 Tax=Schistosoma curassoni TaxID=6186 RepID=A0A183L3X3_9TREM|nr:unnamed protein product [Schistosoma curassoni]
METLDMIQERKNRKTAIINNRTRTEKVKAQAKYTESNQQVKKIIRADKQKYVEELARTVAKAARGNLKQLRYNEEISTRLVSDKESETITEIQEQRKRWVEHFEKLLNRRAHLNPSNIKVAQTDLPIYITSPTIE